MMKTILISATAMALAAPALAQVTTPSAPAAPPASAQPTTPAAPAASIDAKVDVFAKADADKSGSLSIAEVKMADATATQADFDKYDADKSKSLSKAEFEKWSMAKAGAKASAPGQ